MKIGLSHVFQKIFDFFIRGIKSFQTEFFDNTNDEIVGMFDLLWNEDKVNAENLNGDFNITYIQAQGKSNYWLPAACGGAALEVNITLLVL